MYNAFLLNDFYKITHLLQYSNKITHLTSYLTPRGSRLKEIGIDKAVFFGLQGYIKKYLIDGFKDNFFSRDFDSIKAEVTEVLTKGLGYPEYLIDTTLDRLKGLHELGYLPVEINAVPEGTLVPMGVPCVELRSTVSEFFWVGQSLEASLSAAIWHPIISATISREYRKIAKEAFERTVDDNIDERTSMCDFSMRGQESNESAIVSSAGWLTSMWNSSTVMARSYITETYNCGEDIKIGGLTSTEHSVMTSHACLDGGDETPTFKYLFDLYKDVSFAAVCDSYDFWNVLGNILPKFKDVIDERGKRGKFIGIRHDSADPVEAICGITVYDFEEYTENMWWINTVAKSFCLIDKDGKETVYRWNGTEHILENRARTLEEKGIVESLWELFGGSENSKGYKVLNPGIKAVYGDSITIMRASKIYRLLEQKGFAANNVSLGVGSFSFQCVESKDGKLLPFTRDSLSIAIKCTYSRYIDNDGSIQERFVYKDPIGYSGKKSQRGLCVTWQNDEGNIGYTDELHELDRELYPGNIMIPYFKDGTVYKQGFSDIRNRIDKHL